jgi:hypothetical protein
MDARLAKVSTKKNSNTDKAAVTTGGMMTRGCKVIFNSLTFGLKKARETGSSR